MSRRSEPAGRQAQRREVALAPALDGVDRMLDFASCTGVDERRE